MSAEKTKQHFAEICECLWDKAQYQENLDKEFVSAMRRFIATFTMIAWNSCVKQKTYSDVKKFLNKFTEENFGSGHSASQYVFDAAELKWREYREDTDTIASIDVKNVNGKPQAIAYLTDENPQKSTASNPFFEYLNSMGLQTQWGVNMEDGSDITAPSHNFLPFTSPFIIEDEDYACPDYELIEEEYDFDPENLHVLQLKVELIDYDVSAELLVPEDATFADLHTVLNSIFERDDDNHLFRFEIADGFTVVRIEDDVRDFELEEGASLAENCYVGHHLTEGCGAYYLFDYGDEWGHSISVKKVIPVKKKDCKFKLHQITGEIPEQYPDYDDDEE